MRLGKQEKKNSLAWQQLENFYYPNRMLAAIVYGCDLEERMDI